MLAGLYMKDCLNLQEVIDAIRAKGVARIGIDGRDGAGKSTLAQEISGALGLPCISLDCFLEEKMDGYVEHIDYPELKATLEKLEGYVVEGVCLLQVLGRIQLSPSASIYIKRMQHEVWSDEDELDISKPVDAVLAEAREAASLFSSCPVTNLGLPEEVIRYHDEFRPHDHADFIYAVPAHWQFTAGHGRWYKNWH